MFELVQVSEKCYYIQSPAKIGLIKLNDQDVILIDSGNDKDAGRKVRQILNANKWKLKAIYNTHANADHIGGGYGLTMNVMMNFDSLPHGRIIRLSPFAIEE